MKEKTAAHLYSFSAIYKRGLSVFMLILLKKI